MTTPSQNDLIAKIQNGELTPDEAEAEAARLNLKPLAYEPEPEDYEPLNEVFWTLPMAVAWIAYRTPDAVREWWDAYRTECRDWHFRRWRLGFDGPIREGYFLEQRSPASLVSLRLAEIIDSRAESDPGLTMEIAEAKEALWIALQQAFFEATGISAETGKRVPIPAYEWRDLDHIEEGGHDVICTRGVRGGPRYEQVVVRSLPIVRTWPDKLPSQSPLLLPPTMAPSGGGYMPLYCAAQWIATKGDSISFDPSDLEVWRVAFSELLARIASEEVKIIGVRDGQREPVGGFHFAGCLVDYPFAESSIDLIFSEELYLRSYPYLDEESWLKGFDDALVDRRGSRWMRLMVLKSDISRFWPLADAEATSAVVTTGAPGRPSSMHLVEAEFQARCDRGEVEGSLTIEAKALSQWLRDTYPQSPPLTPKTIMNKLRDTYRQFMARPKL
ncbi:hypothetical protein [Microvirga puerhi]|uniref:Uncharacterized protein n=1 Tax=Microvirga puerhi TaxID=2876078 RepID=A0ABS7VRN6_9HYPH|nr:hypothetical protein [Microvirga puerhi]MBZ6077573.1 hypothetical protein [Microvirga puerhi]